MNDFNYESFFNKCNVIHFKNEKEWHELRNGGIGGSEAGIIMNVSPYKTPYQLWEEKTEKAERQFITNEAIEKGNRLEPVMFDLFKALYGHLYDVIDTKDISLSNVYYPHLKANLDGALIEKESGRKGILEIKSTTIQNGSMFKEWKDDQMPITYFFQCLHYLYVTGFDFVVLYAILDIPWGDELGKQETRVIIINRDDVIEDIKVYRDTAFWFWNLIKTNTPPPFMETRNKELLNY